MTWVNNVPLIKNGVTTFTEAGINPSLQALRDRTDFLYDQLTKMSGNVGYTIPLHGFSSDCKKGSIIAINTDTGIYEQACAEWSDEVREDGSWIPSYKSNVLGILLTDIDPSGMGIVMKSGWVKDNQLARILAPRAEIGDYYLGLDGVAEHESRAARDISVYCYTYAADGALHINPGRAEYAGHSHNYVKINANWRPIAQFPGSFPTDAKVGTNITDPAVISLVNSNPNHQCLVKNGQEVMPDNWGIVGTILYLNFSPVTGDEFSLHAITPLLANEPLIRSVKAFPGTNVINVSSAGGKAWIGFNTQVASRDNYTGECITAIEETTGIKSGPVVQGIRAGAGISVTSYRDRGVTVPGVVEVSADQYKNTLIDMSLSNLNQVLVGTSFYGVSYIFPPNSDASLTGTIRIPHFTDTANQAGELILTFQGNGGTINGLEAQILIQPLPAPGDPDGAPIPSTVTHKVPSIAGSDIGHCYSVAIPLGVTDEQAGQLLHSDGMLICTLRSTSSSEISLISMALRLK